MSKSSKDKMIAWFVATLLGVAIVPCHAQAVYSQREQMYKVHMGAWSECHPLPEENSTKYYQDRAADKASASSRHVGHLRDFRHLDAWRAPGAARTLMHTPRIGYQRRDVQCRDVSDKAVDAEHCGQMLASTATERACTVRADCALGDWSAWRARPGGGYTRTRQVLQLPQGGGTECGVVEEVRPLVPEPGAHWAPGSWGPCHVAGVSAQPAPIPDPAAPAGLMDVAPTSDYATGGPCGGGAQRREVTCVRADGRALHPAHCAALPSPPLQQPCEVPCPRDCSVGEWGEWSPCRPLGGCPMYPVQELTTAGYSVRARRVRTAASAGGAACPSLRETRACAAPRCAAWRADPWSACTLAAPDDGCGAGVRTRRLRCLQHDGKEAPASWCARGSDATLARSEECYIACPGDCVLSAWSEWSACSASCAAPGRAAPTRARRRHILAPAADRDEGTYQCPDPQQLVQTEACNTHACSTHAWLAPPWGPCRPLKTQTSDDEIDEMKVDYAMALEETSGSPDGNACVVFGEKSREVSCVQDNDRIVKDSLCAPLVKPPEKHACTLQCPRSCSAGLWSEWSPCPNSCEPAIQSRERRVRGGEGCGARQERRVCTPPRSCSSVAARPAWAAGDWGPCRLSPSVQCGFGRRVRGVWCSVDSHRVDASACAGLTAPPLAETTCQVPCTGGDTSDRHPAQSNEDACKEICEMSGILETAKWSAKCDCANIHVELLTPESDCILPEGSSCGVGRKLKVALCMESAERSVLPMDICQKYNNLTTNRFVRLPDYSYDEEFPGLLQRACVVPCPRDCAAGPWGEWGPCVLEEDSLAAFRTRTRSVLYAAENGGRECGATLQRAACARRELAWRAGDWRACAPADGRCGRGLQLRSVTCTVLDTGMQVHDKECSDSLKPATETECEAPCPQDCVVSQWSDWSPCEQYKAGGRRDRTRVVLRAPAPDGAACPHLVEAEPCASHTYTWFVAPWDDCQPLGGSPCGEGTKRRTVRCMSDDGLYVNDDFCPNATASEARVSWCYVPCGADCELTEWSAWDASVCSCGVGRQFRGQYMVRRRRRVSGAAWPGRACGAEEQRAPCPRTLCMRSVATPQIECQAEEPQNPVDTTPMYGRPWLCGHGVINTLVTCEPYEPGNTLELDRKVAPPTGVHYELSRCAVPLPGRMVAAPAHNQREACAVECGCGAAMAASTLSEWSAWGPCRGGARSRSRRRVLRRDPRCPHPEKFVTIEWANCTPTHRSTPAPPRQNLPDPTPADDRWLGYFIPPDEKTDDHTPSDSSIEWTVSIWLVAGIILIYAMYVPYSAFVRYRIGQRDKGIDNV